MPPVDVTGVRTVAVGTAVWVVMLVGALLFRSRLEAAGNGWWLWTCVAGVVLGVLGGIYCLDRRRRLRRVLATAPPVAADQ